MEIFTGPNEEVVFKKYSPVGEMGVFAEQYADVISRACMLPVLICDRDHVIAVAGESKKEFLEKRISPQLEKKMEDRQAVVANGGQRLYAVEGKERPLGVMVPIISAGDLSGCVCLLCNERGDTPNESDQKLAQVAAAFLGKQMEE